LSGEDLDPRVGRDVCLELVEETSPLELPNGHSINLGTGLNSDEHAIITPILTNNKDLFAWSAANLPGVDPLVASNKLSIYIEARYVSQKKRKLGEECRLAPKVEERRIHRRSSIHHLAFERSLGEESQWQMANVCGLHGSKQGLPLQCLPRTQH